MILFEGCHQLSHDKHRDVLLQPAEDDALAVRGLGEPVAQRAQV